MNLPKLSLLQTGLGIFLFTTITHLSAAESIFRHAGFGQLSKGELGNAGQNLIVSPRGELKLINWFDLDRDGFPEIVINNDHSPYENSDSLIYYQHPVEGFLSLLPTVSDEGGVFERLAWMRAAASRTKFLPSMGGGRSVIADLDGDGWPEIIFTNFIHGSTHDHFPVFVYWGTIRGYSANRRSEFPTESATGVAVADLNGDGRLDLVIANMGHEDDTVFASSGPLTAKQPPIVEGATANAQIYWQGEDGFMVDRVSKLPTRHAVDVKIADLDGDGHLDLVFLQGGDWPSVRVFPGGAGGFSADRVRETPVTGRGYLDGIAGEIAIADLDGDSRLDLAVAAGGAELELFFNRGPDFTSWKKSALPANTPLSVVATDLNQDGSNDLAVTGFTEKRRVEYHTNAYVYWNAANGFSASRSTALPVMGGTTVRAGDVNGDGFTDLAFSNSQDNATYDVPSYLYWGGSNGYTPARRQELMSFGAPSIAIGDLNRDNTVDLFISNRASGHSQTMGAINSFVYWGNPDRSYNKTTLTNVPLTTGFSSSAGDIFDEGRAAIAFTESKGVAVARLAADRSVEEIRRWPMPSRGYTTSLADLDRDGRLDLIVGLIDGEGRNLAILRGSAEGFSDPEYYKPGIPIIASGVADLDGDGRLDLILGGRGGWLFCSLDAKGVPQLDRAQRIPSDFQIQRLTVADLNKDGSPEVIATHYREMTGRRNAIDSAIYWNRKGNFLLEDQTPLPTFGGHWVSVADTRGKGDLDVLYSNYHGETTRIVGLFVYHPDEKGEYSVAGRMVLPAYSSSANFVADLDADGFPDIVAVNHTGPNISLGLGQKTGNHGVGSFVYWGAADGFSLDRRSTIASHGPHKILNAEPGDILRRRPFETYTSPWIDASLAKGDYELIVSGAWPGRSGVGASWQVDNESEWTELKSISSNDSSIRFAAPRSSPTRKIRYRLDLRTAGAGTGPTVTAIELQRNK
ncbi:MAG: VCBS repeat-containing protein [Verrucomicrobia bacterium]|nr:VCBS repeat-containing protein [Verrucomicrobiota bacterium]